MPIGASPSARLGECVEVTPATTTLPVGTVVVTVISNSLNTSNGFSAEPSAVPVSVAPPGPVPGGSDALAGNRATTRATPATLPRGTFGRIRPTRAVGFLGGLLLPNCDGEIDRDRPRSVALAVELRTGHDDLRADRDLRS